MNAGHGLRDALIGAEIIGSGGVRYFVKSLVGEGGQGWVFKARYDDPEGTWIVVKVLRPERGSDEGLKRFEREAEVLRRLGAVAAPNPHIVRFYDYASFEHAGAALPFLALEHVEGPTLQKVIGAHGGFGMPVARVRRLMRQVARALETVHAQQIVHRDLKPSNVLLAQHEGQEVAKVTDFGLVKLPDLSTGTTATVAGASLGYAPPEQYEQGNARVGVRTDVFAFAAILYEMLSGSEAFPVRPTDSPLRVVGHMLSGDRPALARVSATVPRELRDRADLTAAIDKELARALSPDPAVRHASVRDLWERVEPLLKEATRGANASEEGSQPPESLPVSMPATIVVTHRAPAWRRTAKGLTGERLRAGVVAEDGSIVAVGAHGLYRCARGVWSALHLPAGVDARFVRGVRRAGSGDLLLFGDAGLALRLAPRGVAERLPIADRDVALLGAHTDETGVVLVGERLSRPVGVILEVPASGVAVVTSIESTVRLTDVTRARGAIVACGTHGALLEVTSNGPRDIVWGRTGHLYAITSAADGGAFAVGSGGHALRISPSPRVPGVDAPPIATLEAVQTTRDLVAVELDALGHPWAVGGQARVVHRRAGVWTRVTIEPSAEGMLVAMHARRDGVTVLGEDGSVFEGPALDDVGAELT